MKCNIIFFLFTAAADVEVRSNKTAASNTPEVGLCKAHKDVNKVYLFRRNNSGAVAIKEVTLETSNEIVKVEKTLERIDERLKDNINHSQALKDAIDNLNKNIENTRKTQEKIEKERSQEKERIEKEKQEKEKKKTNIKKKKEEWIYEEDEEDEEIELAISPEIERMNKEIERSHKAKMEEMRLMQLTQRRQYELKNREDRAMAKLVEMRRHLEFKRELEEQNLVRQNILSDMKMRDELTNSTKNTLRQQVASSVHLNLTTPINATSPYIAPNINYNTAPHLNVSDAAGSESNKKLEETKQYFHKMVEEKDKEITSNKDSINILKEELNSKNKEIEEHKNKIKEIIHQSSGSNEATKELIIQKELLSNLIKDKEDIIRQKELEIEKLKSIDASINVENVQKYENLLKQKELEIEKLKSIDTSGNVENVQKYENLLKQKEEEMKKITQSNEEYANLLKDKDQEVIKLKEMIKQLSDKIIVLENKTLQDNVLNKQQIEELVAKEVSNYTKEIEILKEKIKHVVKKNDVLEKINQQYTELLQKLARAIQ